MKIISILVSLLSSTAIASTAAISTFTMDAASVQAILHDSMQNVSVEAREKGLQGPVVANYGSVAVSDSKSSVVCEGGSQGMLAVMSYRCSIKGDITTWTMDANSTQANLHKVLATTYKNDKASKYPRGSIKTDGKSFRIADENSSLTCTEKTVGMALAVSYSCTVK